MGEREDNVYKAKLAEQAERYDGKWNNWWIQFLDFYLCPLSPFLFWLTYLALWPQRAPNFSYSKFSWDMIRMQKLFYVLSIPSSKSVQY